MSGNPEQEGWYTDPYGRHEARWMSGGVPTKLCRDGATESYDAPADSPPSQAWVPITPPPGTVTAADTLRADAAEAETMPSLAELNRRETSAAITAQAHPWFIARHWIPRTTQQPKPVSAVQKTALIVGGVAAGLLLLLSTWLWVVRAVAMARPPTIWSGALVASLAALGAPFVTYLIWRGDRRARIPSARCVQRAEVVGSLLGFLSLLIFVALPARKESSRVDAT